jgi:D-alanyl-lipoteichoic acid acyltransferase DltB (MBOAT superfamily)
VLFNSFDFGFFLVIVYLAYWIIGTDRRNAQNVLLLIASYTFYGLWDWRFLGLLIMSSLIDFIAARAIAISRKRSRQKLFLWLSIAWNLGVLFSFKYFNFFIDSFESLFGIEAASGYTFWNVAIPLGLSFYTFQTMSYTIDVFQSHRSSKGSAAQPTKNLLEFLCFVSFFPQLVAGPIEKSRHLLPQFEKKRHFDLQTSKEGLRQILWGLFKKIIVAEKLGIAVTMVFNNPEGYNSITLVFALVLFCFQVYCDFSGYTDIALGTAKLFGFKLSKNFNLPYLSKSISELWQRWHITLTRWFTDYVYIPIVRSSKRISPLKRAFGILVTFTLVGLWHGANWTFVFFGMLSAVVLVLERIPLFRNKKTLKQKLQQVPRVFSMGYVFVIFTLLALLFRANNMSQVLVFLKRIFSFTLDGAFTTLIGYKLVYLVFVLIAEIATREYDFPLQKLELKFPRLFRWAIYYTLIIFIIRYAEPKEAFIYFQF